MPPGTAAGQHVDDRGEHRPLIDIPSAAALRTLLLRRDERLDDLPQLIRDQFSAPLSFPHGRTTPRRSPLIHVRQALMRGRSASTPTCLAVATKIKSQTNCPSSMAKWSASRGCTRGTRSAGERAAPWPTSSDGSLTALSFR